MSQEETMLMSASSASQQRQAVWMQALRML
jgi:hypothetical protein